jgi:putative transcriptional regulator
MSDLKIPFTNIKPSAGKLLIAEPFLDDPYFKRSVVLLTEHNENGSIGFILNKPIEIKLKDAIGELPPIDSNIHLGGPVARETLHFLHTEGELIDGSLEIMQGLFWGGNFETLKKLIEQDKIKPESVKFFVGYSGWEPKQLDKELKLNSWIVLEGDLSIIMKRNTANLWKDILKEKGNEFGVIADFPQDPTMN